MTEVFNSEQALGSLNEISKRIDRIIAIAVAGNAMCEDSTDTQSVLFGLIEYLGRLEIDNEILLKEFIPQVQKVW